MKRIHPSGGHLIVTGASGFLGRAVVTQAQAQGLRVTALTRSDVDLRDPLALAAVIARTTPDMAIDAAGVVPGPSNPDFAENTVLTQGWLDALDRVPQPPRLVLAGSAAVYGDGAAQHRATRETDPMLPTSAYGRAKLLSLDLAVAACVQRGCDVQTGIVFNLIGEGQPPHMVPRVFIERALAAKNGRLEVGHCGDVRDFMHISDAADALIAMATHGVKGDVLNIATGRPTKISEVLDIICGSVGVAWHSQPDSDGLRADHVCYGDSTLLQERTGWRQQFNLETALLRAVQAARHQNRRFQV
ncbi:NAD(P)-dependent oxidoreductase [Pseudorhodobacter sp.]|uniref:NAD-dependent epimerase/dehydratase family protein n=1 Tax=Pseudorhodobacter sp. TaxID=1934400 RepID=UPI00264702CC|nr:NAD-dependent epimerase/dehydratase family protein [Pseudorhodobacter sp.]MDN5786467.1 NAD-dependent epimerase/dehydratase family protein [Pseudorhodobacter sp.]